MFRHAWAMRESYKDDAMVLVPCRKCRVDIIWPATLASSDRALFAETARAGIIAAIQLARSRFGFDGRQAKALAMHITSARGTCNRCRRPITPGEASICEQCNAANLDW